MLRNTDFTEETEIKKGRDQEKERKYRLDLPDAHLLRRHPKDVAVSTLSWPEARGGG